MVARRPRGSFPLAFLPALSRLFRSRLRRDLPQTNHEKKREEWRWAPRGRREEAGRPAEKERSAAGGGTGGGLRGKEREDGGERVRAHTRPRSCNTRMTRRRRAASAGAREKEERARGEVAGVGASTRNGVYSSCFFLSFVDSAFLSGAAEREQHAAAR